MSFVYCERLIEFAIRVGVDDVVKDPTLLNLMFGAEKHLKEGADLTPPGQEAGSVREPLPFDYFQKRLQEIPKRQAETGKQEIFANSIPSIPDVSEYLQTANIRIMHGFPREEKDLPAISITLGNEDESGGQQYLGGIKDTVQAANKRYEIIGSDWSSQYMIQILSPNYDETVIWYFLIKYALTRYRRHIEGYGMRQQNLSWMDVELASQFVESGLYIYQRSCILSCVKSEDVPVLVDGFDELAMKVPPMTGDGSIVPNPGGTEPVHPLEYTEEP